MSDHYELWTPAQAVERLAAELPGGRADAEQVIASYLWDATGVHGRPSSGWRLDEFDLDDARARFGWVDFAGGETVVEARDRAAAATAAAMDETSGIWPGIEEDRLAGPHSDVRMWVYRSYPVGVGELTDTTACDPKPGRVELDRQGRERSHREATAAHDARQAVVEAAAMVAALDDQSADQRYDHNGQDEEDRVDPDRDRVGGTTRPMAQDAREEATTDERGDRERVLDEGTGSFAGGMWFTPDPAVEGGVRPLTEAEMVRVCDVVRRTQREAVAAEHDDTALTQRAPSSADMDGWER